MNFDSRKSLKFDKKSTFKFFSVSNQSFNGSSEGNLIVGIGGKLRKFGKLVQIENINSPQNPSTLGECSRSVLTCHVNEELSTILVGGAFGNVIQYALSPGRAMYRIIKKYIVPTCMKVLCMSSFKHVVAFGGFSDLFFVDLRKRRIVGQVDTIYVYITSIHFCELSNKKVYLTVFGRKEKRDSEELTNWFDVTDLLLEG
jgi:hypothetical protein